MSPTRSNMCFARFLILPDLKWHRFICHRTLCVFASKKSFAEISWWRRCKRIAVSLFAIPMARWCQAIMQLFEVGALKSGFSILEKYQFPWKGNERKPLAVHRIININLLRLHDLGLIRRFPYDACDQFTHPKKKAATLSSRTLVQVNCIQIKNLHVPSSPCAIISLYLHRLQVCDAMCPKVWLHVCRNFFGINIK